MQIEIVEESAAALADYALVPIEFEVHQVLDMGPSSTATGDFFLRARDLATPIHKDYDSVPHNRPTDWPARFDISNWGFLSAWDSGRRVGGAAVAFGSPSIDMLEGCSNLPVLWDIRVTPAMRGQGIGSALLGAVEEWIRQRGGRWLKVETQNINVPAFRFYDRHGFVLKAINRSAYPEFPEEIQLLWYKAIPESLAPARDLSGH